MSDHRYRQGDIYLKRVDEAHGKRGKKQERITVAEGEATGHFHVLEACEGATLYETITDTDRRFIEIMSANGLAGAELAHDEHATITIPPGIYEVKRQREYAEEAPRYVAD